MTINRRTMLTRGAAAAAGVTLASRFELLSLAGVAASPPPATGE